MVHAFDRGARAEGGILCSFFFQGYKFASDAEECVDGSQRGGCTRIPQYEQDFSMEQTLEQFLEHYVSERYVPVGVNSFPRITFTW